MCQNGPVTEMVTYKDDGSVQYRYCQGFGAESQLIMAAEELGTPDSSYVERYRLGDNGQMAEMSRFDGSGKLEYRVKFTYEFDEHGNWVERRVEALRSDDGKPKWVTCWVVERTIMYRLR